jgi:hypothetical protein
MKTLDNNYIKLGAIKCKFHMQRGFGQKLVLVRMEYLIGIKNTPWPESVSELYQLSDRSLSAKLVPTFED